MESLTARFKRLVWQVFDRGWAGVVNLPHEALTAVSPSSVQAGMCAAHLLESAIRPVSHGGVRQNPMAEFSTAYRMTTVLRALVEDLEVAACSGVQAVPAVRRASVFVALGTAPELSNLSVDAMVRHISMSVGRTLAGAAWPVLAIAAMQADRTGPSSSNGTENRCFGRTGQGTLIAQVVGAIKRSGLDALALEGDVGDPF